MTNWLQFIEVVLNSWPLAIVILAVLLRKPLIRIMNSMRSFVAEFGSGKLSVQLEELEVKASAIPSPPVESEIPAADSQQPNDALRGPEPTETTGTVRLSGRLGESLSTAALAEFDTNVLSMLSIGPVPTISWAWELIELIVASAASKLKPDGKSAQPTVVRDQLDTLFRHSYIEADLYDVIRQLSGIRNRAVHGGEVSLADAISFARITRTVIPVLSAAAATVGKAASP